MRGGVLAAALGVWLPAAAGAQADGRALYGAACAACHGVDGTGMPHALVGFDTPLPDFTDCSFATREPDADWAAVALGGGPVRAFSSIMPAFGEALTEDEILRIVGHIRTFCPDDDWPPGELNLPRAIVTEKAYPEDEAVLTLAVPTGERRALSATLVYERRVGARGQVELIVPFRAQEREAPGGGWARGMGDVALGYKHALHHSARAGRILSAAAEVILPTGDGVAGLGKGAFILEPFLSFGQALPSDAFIQLQAGGEVPLEDLPAEAFGRAAFGKTFTSGAWGRAWTPMVELLAARELEEGTEVAWDVLPQLQVSLPTRQHVLLSAGVRAPLGREGETEVLVYLLWDWFDGGLRDGW